MSNLKAVALLFLVSCAWTACAADRATPIVVSKPIAQAMIASTGEDHRPDAGMLRYPDVSATHIVFVYSNDIWLVPREGGQAVPLASPPGQELFPRFSPDGSLIGFVGNYDGNRDLYTIPTSGGIPKRITHHPARETLCDWTPSGEMLFFTNAFAGLGRQSQLHTVPATGGIPNKLPVPQPYNRRSPWMLGQ